LLRSLPNNHDINHLRGALRECKRFNVAIDGGAHRGIWTKELAGRFNQVYAFEPVTENLVKMPEYPNVVKYNVGLGDESGTFAMFPGKDNTGQWHFGGELKEGMISASTIRLDSLRLSPDFIKLDVEGYELFALQGAVETIKRSKPLIMLELNGLSERYGHTDDDVRGFMTDLGYREIGKWNKDYLFSL